MLLLGDTIVIQVNWKLRLSPEYFLLLMPVNQQAKKRVFVLAPVIDRDNHGEIRLTTK